MLLNDLIDYLEEYKYSQWDKEVYVSIWLKEEVEWPNWMYNAVEWWIDNFTFIVEEDKLRIECSEE